MVFKNHFVNVFLIINLCVLKPCSLTWFPVTAENGITKSVPDMDGFNQVVNVKNGNEIRDKKSTGTVTKEVLEDELGLKFVDQYRQVFIENNDRMLRKDELAYNNFHQTLYNKTFDINNSRFISGNANQRNFDGTGLRTARPKLRRHFKCGGLLRRRIPIQRRNRTEGSSGKGKFLEIFQVVNIERGVCVASSGLDGDCLHEYACNEIGGVGMGECADGFGVCCVFQLSCDAETSASASWFTNPGFPAPSAERLACAVSINKASDDVVQIKLELVAFELQPPTEGVCVADQFVVSGQSANSIVPIICGVNNGQHMYIDVSDGAGPIYLSVQTVAPESRLFAIKVTQLISSEAVTASCLQHFSGTEGVLESFNYQDKSTLVVSRLPSYLNNMNYAMCIQREPGHCSITYTNVEEDRQNSFQILNYDTYGLPTIPPGQAGVETYNCPSDYLATSGLRLCGERLNDGSFTQDFSSDAPVTDISAGPIVMIFKSDSSIVGRGFRLHYIQNPCSNIA